MVAAYFRTDTSEPIGFIFDKVPFTELGQHFRLKPESIRLNGFSVSEDVDWKRLVEQFRQRRQPVGATEADPVTVTGDTAVPTSPTDFEDRSGEWIQHMVLPPTNGLPRDEVELAKVLFPQHPGKLPVLRSSFDTIRRRQPIVAKDYLILADDAKLSVLLSEQLDCYSCASPVNSEANVSSRLIQSFTRLFDTWTKYGPCEFTYKLLFNLNERTGDSFSGSTKRRSRPVTLVTASGCTFLVGEDKCANLTDAKSDLEGKMEPLSAMFYGEVRFILGYVAAGLEFQWLYINKSGKITEAGARLNLSTDVGCCRFLLSIGYAYQLISKMVDTVPQVPGRYAMFTKEKAPWGVPGEGDRTIDFHATFVRKSIEKFDKFCKIRFTELAWILKAYDAGERKGCRSLPRLRWSTDAGSHTGSERRMIDRGRAVSRNTYTVEIYPLGFSPILKSEQDTRMLVKNVCEALSVLHEAGLVHRDVRYPNIVQVSEEQFMLIDLETVAAFPFEVPRGFEYFSGWSEEMFEGGSYTPMSDMYQLGKLLEDNVPKGTVVSTPAQQFIRSLLRKEYTAATALCDPWLSDRIP
ncbi:hypothetical protein KC19_6G022400 [Ceratodon purpureus]|uniref:Protein kinase domain-containing protein n=1 Tax=Ceratodon purpureus TaxID=3225 RepID=A0A8T0HDX7_CERPU|nr:hypothetical protein KC19_6G022400 [Ceratodon purpureus]